MYYKLFISNLVSLTHDNMLQLDTCNSDSDKIFFYQMAYEFNHVKTLLILTYCIFVDHSSHQKSNSPSTQENRLLHGKLLQEFRRNRFQKYIV